MECVGFTPPTTTTQLNTDFCLQIANHVLLNEISSKVTSNFVISPLSIHVILSLIALGSNGHTLEQLLFFLQSRNVDHLISMSSQMAALASPPNRTHDEDIDAGGPTLSFVNGAWLNKGLKLKPSFQLIVTQVYNAIAKEVDFVTQTHQVINEINSWAENATKGLVKNLLPLNCLEGNEDKTALILANALYFKASWDQSFDISNTKHKDFYLLNGETVKVPFMTNHNYVFHFYGSFDGYKLLKIPYQKGHQDTRQFAMYFFLPNQVNGLENLVNKIKSDSGFFSQQFMLSRVDIPDLWIPRFKFSYEFKAKQTMQELGLELPFDDGKAEIMEMVLDTPKTLFVSEIYHKSYIEVNEEGTEAAASTGAILMQQQQQCRSFVANHPFMFMIREETSNIVFFVGAVLNPLSES
ncbi:hypothetical protein LWI29_033551 [Acer saccharum]|uniref:Serpin domain-containing protein n=1 Tax=Acer saccharum TaxID=4024 RepID=A0AA39SYR6_ACESA|nr:hypothetical protein LWI29_033551 [Acer saccharum]